MIVLWEPLYPGDARSKIPANLFADARVVSFWDPHAISGIWFGKNHVGAPAGVVWDAYYAFAPSARWGRGLPNHLVDSGSPVIGNTGSLRHSFLPLLQ